MNKQISILSDISNLPNSFSYLVLGATGGIGESVFKKISKNTNCSVIGLGRKKKNIPNYKRFNKINSKTILKSINYLNPSNDKILIINSIGRCFYGNFLSTNKKILNKIVRDNIETNFEILRGIIEYSEINKAKIIYVDISSQAGLKSGHKYFSLYSMVKSAIRGLLNSLAPEFNNISFISIQPKGVNTNIYDHTLGNKNGLKKKFSESDLINLDDFTDILILKISEIINSKNINNGEVINIKI